MSILDTMEEPQVEPPNTPDSSPNSSDSESPSSEPENLLPTVNEPDVSLDEMLSLACRQGKLDIVQLLLQSGAHVNHRNKAGNTPLLEACSQGHVAVANYLIENGSKIDAPTETTLDSALTWACTLGNTNIVDALLYKKADVEHRTKDGCTALMFACLAGHKDVAEKLLDASSEINVESDSNKDSPLTFACWKGHFDVVELLLLRSANIEHRTKEGFSPLMFAALGGHTKVARKLLECDAQVNVPSGSNNDIPLTSACWKGHCDVVNLLLEFKSSIEHRTKDGCTPLMLAAREGHIHVAELLLHNNSQVNVPSGSENNIPLTLACWKGHWEVVRLLLEYGSDIEHRNKAGCTPLMLAAREGHYETTALLLEKHAQVNVPSGSNDDTPLTLACWKGHKNVVLLLLNSKSNLDHQTKTGCTPLMEATREGHRDVADILLNHNADVELPDNYGQSPLFMACWKGHQSVAELLLQRHAYRDCRTKTGITPLFQACRENHVSIVELLLEYGAGANNPFPNSRETPMTLCAEKGHKELVRLLLVKGASHDCRTKKGCTPAFLSCKEGHIEILQMLYNQGSNTETPDCRGNTPIMAAFKNGHVAIVEWLITFVHHLPSDELCHKILMSAVDEKDKELVVQRRSKCLAVIQETKKKRELLALRNAQNLVEELNEEKNREEKKKKKKAAKRRDKQNKRKKNRENEQNEQGSKLNGVIGDHDDEDDIDEEEIKDHVVPTENREHCTEEKLAANVEILKISEIPVRSAIADTTARDQSDKISRRRSRKKPEATDVIDEDEKVCESLNKKNKQSSVPEEKPACNKTYNQPISRVSNSPVNCSTQIPMAHINQEIMLQTDSTEVAHMLANQLTDRSSNAATVKANVHINRQLPKTSGACTQSSSTLGPSRLPASCQTDNSLKTSYVSPVLSTKSQVSVPVVSSIAITTSTQVTTAQSDPRTDYRNITPTEPREDWEEELEVLDKKDNYSRSDSNSAASTSSVSRNSSFDEYKESDWKELSKTSKLVIYELTVPNAYCGRVIGKGGKKINLITDESGAQITIDKPPSNIIPHDRVITIRGNPQSSEKARHMVTKSLNSPGLNNQGIGVSDSAFTHVSRSTPVPLSSTIQSLARENSKPVVVSSHTDSKIKQPRLPSARSLANADVPVTPLLSYSKVTTGTFSSDEIQKKLQSQPQNSSSSNPSSSCSALPQKSEVNHQNSDTDSSSGQGSLSKEHSPPSHSHPLPIKSEGFASKYFSYFTQDKRRNSVEHKGPLQSISTFVEPNRSLTKDHFPWKIVESSNNSENTPESALFDRSRSISWTGRPNPNLSNEYGPGNRSLSTEAINDRQGTVASPWNLASRHAQSNDELSDEQVFAEDILWTCKPKVDTAASSTCNDGWDMSSSPTSSVSSSKVELTNILDNDSGMGGSNPLGPTPPSVQSELRIRFQDQPYLETAIERLQSRGAYSAPSSPAPQRNGEDHCRHSPKTPNIRSHPSMEELNLTRPWVKKPHYRDAHPWIAKSSLPSFSQWKGTTKPDTPPENHDSGLSSPRSSNDRHPKGFDNDSVPSGSATPWSAERFQDVYTLTELLGQLSLDKYAAKLEEHGLTLESLVTLNEKDLQTFDIPKGPRLKILKACDVIKSQRRPGDRTPMSTNADPSTQTYFPNIPTSLQHQSSDQQSYSNKQQPMFSSAYRYHDFLPYSVQPQPYGVIIPNNQQFIHPSIHQHHPIQQTMFATCDEYAVPHPAIEAIHHGQTMIPQPYMFPENQTYYYYPPQT